MTLLAQRWDKVVDFGSPMTAWTQEMLAQHREFGSPMSAWTQEMLAQRQRPGDGQITAVEVEDALTT